MPLITEQPVALVSADNWEIADVRIDPAGPTVIYQVVARLGSQEVRRTAISVAPEELMSDPQIVQLYGAIRAMLYADAQGRGEIPLEAEEPPAPVNAPADGVEVSNGTSE